MAEKKSENAKAAAKKTAKSLMFSKGSQSTSAPVRVKSKRSHGPQRSRQQRTLALSLLW